MVGKNGQEAEPRARVRRDGRSGLPRPGTRQVPIPASRRGPSIPDGSEWHHGLRRGSCAQAHPAARPHPEEWMGRDSVFERTDIDPLVKRAIYTTMIRCVSEVILSKGPRVLMVKAVRGYSKGYWNIPGGFMDYGEGPEAGAEREAMEEIGTEVALDGLLNVYVS